MNRECPANTCVKSISAHMLMCRPHWYMVSAATRAEVWNAWAGGLGAGTDAHNRAILKAVAEVDAKLASKTEKPAQ